MTTYEMEDFAQKREPATELDGPLLAQPALKASGNRDSAEQVWALAVAGMYVCRAAPAGFCLT
jgi:hypothetical protein